MGSVGSGSGSGSGSGMGPAVASLPPPCPKSPPEYPDLYGRRREMAKLQLLERERSLLEEELKFVDGLQPASRCCKETVDFVIANGDPLIPTNRKISKSSRLWKWLCGLSCFNLSWVCCCTGCSVHLKALQCCCCCCNEQDCIRCSLPKCSCWCNPCSCCCTENPCPGGSCCCCFKPLKSLISCNCFSCKCSCPKVGCPKCNPKVCCDCGCGCFSCIKNCCCCTPCRRSCICC